MHITCLITIDPAAEESGCLEFVAGRHNEGLIGVTNRGIIDKDIAEGMDFIPIETMPGDIIAFSSYAPHRSGVNRTGLSRRILYTTFNAASEGNLREAYYSNKRRELATGTGVGSLSWCPPEQAACTCICFVG